MKKLLPHVPPFLCIAGVGVLLLAIWAWDAIRDDEIDRVEKVQQGYVKSNREQMIENLKRSEEFGREQGKVKIAGLD